MDHLIRQSISIIVYTCVVMRLFLSESFGQQWYITTKTVSGAFTPSASSKPASILVNHTDVAGVLRPLKNLQHNIYSITDPGPTLSIDKIRMEDEVLVIGTIGKSSLTAGLTKNKKLDVNKAKDKWEA